MLAWFRRIFILAFTGGGVYGAYWLLKKAVQAAGGGQIVLAGEGALLLIPVALVGAVVGAILGGLLFPAKL